MVESIPLSMAYGLTYLAVCVSFFPIVAIGMGYEVGQQVWITSTLQKCLLFVFFVRHK